MLAWLRAKVLREAIGLSQSRLQLCLELLEDRINPVQVSSVAVAPPPLGQSPTALVINFDTAASNATLASNYAFVEAGPDGQFSDGQNIPFQVQGTDPTATVTLVFSGLRSDLYQLTVSKAITDNANGSPLIGSNGPNSNFVEAIPVTSQLTGISFGVPVPGNSNSPLVPGAVFYPNSSTLFEVLGSSSQGSPQPLTSGITFSSSNSNVATVDSQGNVTALAPGQATISAATNDGRFKQTVTAIVVPAGFTLSNENITPASAALPVRQSLTYKLSGTFDTTYDFTSVANWTTNGQFANFSSPGVVTAQAVGTTSVSASILLVSGMGSTPTPLTVSTPLNITASTATLTGLVIGPSSPPLLAPNAQIQLFVNGQYSDGTTGQLPNGDNLSWTSSNPTIATVNSFSGVVVAVTPGTTTINATDTTSGLGPISMSVTVLSAPLGPNFVLSPSQGTVTNVGDQIKYTVTGRLNGAPVDLSNQATWTVSDSTLATVDATGNVTALALGTTNVQANFTLVNAPGQQPTFFNLFANLNITGQLTGLLLPGAQITQRASLVYPVYGQYSATTPAPLTGVTFHSETPAVADFDPQHPGVLIAKTVGVATIDASYVLPSDSMTFTSKATVLVTASDLTSIVIHPKPANAVVGATVAFTVSGTFADGSTQDITPIAFWVINNNNPNNVSSVASLGLLTGLATGLAPGTVPIDGGVFAQPTSSSSATTLMDSTSLTVVPLSLSQVTIAPSAGTNEVVNAGGTFTTPLQVIVKDQFGNPVSGVSVTFTVPDGPGATFANGATTAVATTNAAGIATAPTLTANNTPGTYTVTAVITGVGTPATFSVTNTLPNAGIDELGAYRPTDGSWSLDSNGQFGFQTGSVAGPSPLGDRTLLGFVPPEANLASVTPVSGDWTNLGATEIGDFVNGTWYLDLNNNGTLDSGETFSFGTAGDVPVPGDYLDKGQVSLAVWRPFPALGYGEFLISDANWLAEAQTGQTIGVAESFIFGAANDHVVVGDWNGQGLTEVGVFRDAVTYIAADAGDAVFTLDVANHHTFDGSNSVFVFGKITDQVVIGDWDGSGTSKVGVYRSATAFGAPNTAVFSLDLHGALDFTKDGENFEFGQANDKFVTGRWAYTSTTAGANAAGAELDDGAMLAALLGTQGRNLTAARDAHFASS